MMNERNELVLIHAAALECGAGRWATRAAIERMKIPTERLRMPSGQFGKASRRADMELRKASFAARGASGGPGEFGLVGVEKV